MEEWMHHDGHFGEYRWQKKPELRVCLVACTRRLLDWIPVACGGTSFLDAIECLENIAHSDQKPVKYSTDRGKKKKTRDTVLWIDPIIRINENCLQQHVPARTHTQKDTMVHWCSLVGVSVKPQ